MKTYIRFVIEKSDESLTTKSSSQASYHTEKTLVKPSQKTKGLTENVAALEGKV